MFNTDRMYVAEFTRNCAQKLKKIVIFFKKLLEKQLAVFRNNQKDTRVSNLLFLDITNVTKIKIGTPS